jgi:hypothetical protein
MRSRRFVLLWRGTRDGFAARDFHDRCDGHPNTLTLIQDTEGNVFGGFTPVEWESREWNRRAREDNNTRKGDPSQQSFVFTLINRHNVPPMKFPIREGKMQNAIFCDAKFGPRFGGDILVADRCNEASHSQAAGFGWTYTSDPGVTKGVPDCQLLTGENRFVVKEIEVFGAID